MGIRGAIDKFGQGKRISLASVAITHFKSTGRPIRIAIDIPIWLVQMKASCGGKNPELRALFYRLLRILELPIHPLFVFDGTDKPPFKRGKAIQGQSYECPPIIQPSKALLDLFRFPHHKAPGEAEAECASLQMAGVVDAVMSNDVDTLMFGSRWTFVNFSSEPKSGTNAATHVTCYEMGDGGTLNAELDRPGMILFAMLCGADYHPPGITNCGSKLAAEIARAGFGRDLLEIMEADTDLDTRLNEWRARLQYELDENKSGHFRTKHKGVRIPETFPDETILSYYAKPIVSSQQEVDYLRYRLRSAWDKDLDLPLLRQFTVDTLGWTYRHEAIKFISLLAKPLLSYKLRIGKFLVPDNGLNGDHSPALSQVFQSRNRPGTGGHGELQFYMVPIHIVDLDLSTERPGPSQSEMNKERNKQYDPYAIHDVWLFEHIAACGIPETVERWRERAAGAKKRKRVDITMAKGSILKYLASSA
ncbi:hypothetical protein BDV12DRAFT_205089 [Aspergillus spectabilis]